MRVSARVPIFLGIISFLIAVGVVTVWYRQTPVPEDITAANVGATSFNVAWLTKKAARGCAIAIADTPEFTFWDLFKSQFYRNYAGKYVNKACFNEKLNTHMAAFTNLFDDFPYKVAVIVGPRRVELPQGAPVVTNKISQTDEPPQPNPAYGSVEYKDESPAVGALVFFYQNQTEKFHYPLVAVTNNDGNYAIDLANFNESEDTPAYDSYLVNVIDLEGKKTQQELPKDIHQPFPPVLIFK